MAKLKCKAHGRRVWVFGGKVYHRTGDCTGCTFPVQYRGATLTGSESLFKPKEGR